jgi:hypothetical protein
MKRRTLLLLGILAPFAAQAQQPVQQTAQAFLESLYAPYRTKDFKGQPYTRAERFFEPILAHAMQRDYQRAKGNGVPPTLNGDPFVDAQDWEISDLSVRVTASGERATGTVSFVNFTQKKTLAVSLVQTPGGWRIADIVGGSGSLRALYKTK